MRRRDRNRHRPPCPGRECPSRRSFTLVEAVVSIAIVAVMLVAGLSTLAASRRGQYIMDTRSRGHLLAQALMAEILRQRYEEPEEEVVFGPELPETHFVRQLWDDVDDYRGWRACPPQDKNGTVMAGLEGWSRRVVVEWVNPADLTGGWSTDTGVKKVTVTVTRNSDVVASTVAIRTEAWPDEDRLKVLFVVTSSGNPTAQERARRSLMSLWGFAVTLMDASAPQSSLDNALSKNDVAYVSEEISAAALGTKLREASAGVVSEKIELADEFGICSNYDYPGDRSSVEIIDKTHYITSVFDDDWVTVFTSSQPVTRIAGQRAAGLHVLGMISYSPASDGRSLAVVETGAELLEGSAAAGRRVQLPFGAGSFDVNALNQNGKTLMKRAIEWAANREEAP